MSSREMGIFEEWAPVYRERGFWPRPIYPGKKACWEKGWQMPDHQQTPELLQEWLDKRKGCGIGLLMGTPFPDGTRLGALDIDRNEYVGVGKALLRDPICGRIGKKGAVFFVRVMPGVKQQKFTVKGEAGKEYGQVAECLFDKALCVIPPTIHPDTNQPYHWIGAPLHEVDFNKLPIIGA